MRVRLEVNHRTVSLLVAGLYLAVAMLVGGLEAVLRTLMFLILPLACIWFSDTLGGGTGLTFGGGYITKPSPGFVVYFLGWVLLAMPVIAVILSVIFNFKLL
jgi:hypothetical protein